MRKQILLIIVMLACVAIFGACFDDVSTSECKHSGGMATCQKKAVCEKCGEEYGELAAHAYGEWKYNAEKHWKECTTEGCDSKAEEAAHAFTKTGSDSEKHWKECECGAKSEEEAHNYTENKFDTEKHWKECECGAKSEETAHVLSYDKDDAQHWQKCACGYETAKVDHVLTGEHNDAQHWKKCDCGYETTKADHVLADDHNDAQHWKKCDCGYETAKENHVLTNDHNDTQHWQKCDCGYETAKADHVLADEHNDTQHWQKCDCGYETAKVNHVLVDEYNDTQHWQKCDCGYETAKADHVLTGDHNETQHWQKCNCGYETAKADHVLTDDHNETQHWQKCECGYESEKKNHEYTVVKSSEDGVYDEYYCTCGVESAELKFKKTVDEGDRTIVLTSSDLTLNLSGVSAYKTVESIMLGEISLGNDVNALDVDALKTATQSHGEQTITVVVKTEDGVAHTISVPVTIVTANISSLQQWIDNIVITNTDANDAASRVFGYYVLTSDFVIGGTELKTTVKPAAANGAFGFRGTLVGANKTITIEKGAETGLGIFAFIGDGALIKDLNIVNNSEKAPNWNSNITLALIARNATLENVNITINNANHTAGVRYGALTHEGMVGCTLDGVSVNIKGNVEALIGGNNPVLSLKDNTFRNCEINLADSLSSIKEIGHNGTTVYVAEGMSAENGETVVNGIKIVKPTILERQIFSLADTESKISLGSEYNGYNIVSIVSEKDSRLNGFDYASVSALFGSDYGKHDLTVTLEKNGKNISVIIPVTIATDTVASADEWQNKVVMKELTQQITGYIVLLNNISSSDIGYASWSFRPNASTDVTTHGFLGTLDGNGKTVTIEENGKSGLGIFTILAHGSVVKDLTITSNSGKNPDGIDGFILARVATYTTFENVTININNANHADTNKDGALCQYGFVGCTFKNFVINISGSVQTLCGSSNNYLGWKNNKNVDITINLKSAESSLKEFAHVGDTVYVAEGMSTANGETTVSGVKLNQYSE